jgi:hypothetical protein
MASVFLDIVPPNQPDLTDLEIEESASKDGPWGAPIEIVTPVGTYPNYLSSYTTDQAAATTNWFRIRFKDSKGAYTPYSQPIKGGTDNVVSLLVDRVLLRDPNISEAVAQQEAEAVLQWYFKGVDPYGIDPATVTYTQMSGLTLLTLARALLFDQLVGSTSSADGWTAGLVSIKSGSTSSAGKADILELLKQANTLLGLNISVIAQMDEISIAGGQSLVAKDQSRLVMEFE